MNVRCKIPILTTQTAHRPPILYNEGYNMLTKKEFDILVLLTESKEPMRADADPDAEDRKRGDPARGADQRGGGADAGLAGCAAWRRRQ